VAKQKPVVEKKVSKGKPGRPVASKASKAGRKPSGAPKPASKTAAGGASPRKKPLAMTPKEALAKKSPQKKVASKASGIKGGNTTSKASAAVKSQPAVKGNKPLAPAMAAKPTKGVAARPVTVRPAGEPVSKREEPAKPGKTRPPMTSGTVKPVLKAKVPVKAPAPRVSVNGPVAGVLQAARSVASRTNKVVEVEKERKSHLTAEELSEFRQILLDKRRELVDDMVNLEDEARRTGTEGGSASSAMPIHMADLGSDTWEQEFTLNLIEKERTIVREIDEALDRIEKKTYGTCLATGKAISKARLRVKPWAKYCIEYARKRELGLT
jgi:RNA polymerase-binding protein DksA